MPDLRLSKATLNLTFKAPGTRIPLTRRFRITEGVTEGYTSHSVVNHVIQDGGAGSFLKVPQGTKLVLKWSVESKSMSKRREAALAAMRELRERRPRSMVGLVPLYGVCIQADESSRQKTAGLMDPVSFYELMPHAGKTLEHFIQDEGVGGWGKRGELAAVSSMLAPARALVEIHGLTATEASFGGAAAHRDIKPSNLFVLRQGEPGFQSAIHPWKSYHDAHLVRIGDFGLFYFTNHDPDATETTNAAFSGYWSPPEVADREALKSPQSRDVWSFAATLFFALTGEHPWASIEKGRLNGMSRHEAAHIMRNEISEPDSPRFDEIHPRLKEVIRECLGPPNQRPSMGVIVQVMQAYVRIESRALLEQESADREKAHKIRTAERERKEDARREKIKRAKRLLSYIGVVSSVFAALFVAGSIFIGTSTPNGWRQVGDTADSVLHVMTGSRHHPPPGFAYASDQILLYKPPKWENRASCHPGDSLCASVEVQADSGYECPNGAVLTLGLRDMSNVIWIGTGVVKEPVKSSAPISVYVGFIGDVPVSNDVYGAGASCLP